MRVVDGRYIDDEGEAHDLDDIVEIDPDAEYDDGTPPMTYRELIAEQAAAPGYDR